jgi:AcrR family transcriptional regulator
MESTKSKIITATVALVEEFGLEGAATAKIAARAKVAIGTLFHHFPNKQLLFEATYHHIMEDYVWHLMGFFDYPDEQVSKQLKGAIKASIDYWVRNNQFYGFIDQMTSSTFFTPDIKDDTSIKMDKHLGQLFKLGLKKKQIRRYGYPFMVEMLFRTIFQAAGLIIDTKEEEKEYYRKQCFRFIWSAISV